MTEENNSGSSPDFRNMSIASNNNGFNTANALQIRLDTGIVDEFEKYLKGVDNRWVTNSDGKLEEVVIYQGQPMVNKEGYQAIMQWINIAINKTTCLVFKLTGTNTSGTIPIWYYKFDSIEI